jgi:hypothetical protein
MYDYFKSSNAINIYPIRIHCWNCIRCNNFLKNLKKVLDFLPKSAIIKLPKERLVAKRKKNWRKKIKKSLKKGLTTWLKCCKMKSQRKKGKR